MMFVTNQPLANHLQHAKEQYLYRYSGDLDAHIFINNESTITQNVLVLCDISLKLPINNNRSNGSMLFI